jgi:TATA-binding protein-associated factor Taf7
VEGTFADVRKNAEPPRVPLLPPPPSLARQQAPLAHASAAAPRTRMEDVFILRAPPALAARLRRVLAEEASAAADAASLELVFSEDGRTGHLRVGADTFPAKLLDLPTKVESWKSLDDVNLVKSADIGQIVVVAPPGGALPTDDVSVNGVTVALRCARPLLSRAAAF